MCDYSSQRPGDVITAVSIDDFIRNNFGLPSVPNKIPDLPNEKAFPNGMFPINIKKMDDMKYIDHDDRDF
jgi:hypothetical protein